MDREESVYQLVGETLEDLAQLNEISFKEMTAAILTLTSTNMAVLAITEKDPQLIDGACEILRKNAHERFTNPIDRVKVE